MLRWWLQCDVKNRSNHVRAHLLRYQGQLDRGEVIERFLIGTDSLNWAILDRVSTSGCEQLPADFEFITPFVECGVGLGTNRNDLMVDYIGWWHKCMKCINFNKNKTIADAEALAICIWRLRCLCKRSCSEDGQWSSLGMQNVLNELRLDGIAAYLPGCSMTLRWSKYTRASFDLNTLVWSLGCVHSMLKLRLIWYTALNLCHSNSEEI